MEQHSFDYSTKNIPIPSKKLYLKRLVEKTEQLIKRMRWKAHFFDKEKTESEEIKECFGFKTSICPPQHPDLVKFEEDLMNMIKNVSFKNIRNDFQDKLRADLTTVKSSNKAFVFADKTRNSYKMGKDTYDKLHTENITKSYKITNPSTYNNINQEAKKIAMELKIADRIECMAVKESYITLKDHKEDFLTNTKCRLINPAKSEIGKVSKEIIANINSAVKKASNVNQWINTVNVIEWFKRIEDKSNCIFVQFDIEEFYPSISKDLFLKSINYAKQFTSISQKDIDIILHARKSLLFGNGKVWNKKFGDPEFDVTMGSFDGAEICELVGLYILSVLSKKFEKENIGLYRDDGLAYFHGISGPTSDRIRKDIIKIFKDFGLRITIKTNLKIVNFLDVTFNLNTATYEPYNKPNDVPKYIHVNSNHPPNITKAIPKNISRRINVISSDRTIFEKAAPYYNKALKESGYKESIMFDEKGDSVPKRKRARNIIWYNPPYSMNVKTNIGKTFLKLISRNFPKGHKLYKIFNRNNMKLSYSCMPNIASIIQSHNKQIVSDKPNNKDTTCNCRQKENCPLDGKCMQRNVIYIAKVENGPNYIGLTEHSFKDRYYKHKNSFRYNTKVNSTELSKHVWEMKTRNNNEPTIKWSIIDSASPYINGSKKCHLCLTEKYHIITSKLNLLNKRSELVSKCRHENKHYLKNFKAEPPDS